MSKLRRTFTVTFLTVALTVSAIAGTIDSPGAPAPPPSGTSTTSTSITTTVILTILSLIR